MEDLFIRYFTSSQDVKKLIDTYGTDEFEKLILIEDCNSDVILYKENEIIKEHINDELCLNKFYHNSDCERKFSTSGTKVYKNAEGLYIKRKHHPGDGWIPGPLPRTWWTNGIDEVLALNAPGSDWIPGCLPRQWYNNGDVSELLLV